MELWTPAPRHIVLAVFLLSALYIHLRGRVRFGVVRAMTDFTVLLAPLNALMYLFSKVRPTAYISPSEFPEMQVLTSNWKQIREEAARLNDEGFIKAADGYTDMGFNSFFRTGWKRFYLKWYGAELPSAARMCPKTVALLQSIPSVKAAMFASLPPGARLVRHRDPYAGSLRYHLGLMTPNSEGCFIDVDGERYSWHDGEAVMFDETYIHFAENTTQQPRVILFCDVERPLHGGLMVAFNRWFARFVVSLSATQNVPGEKIGALNRLFGGFYQLRLRAKALKARSRTTYYVLKWLLLGGLFYLIFV